MTRRSSSLNGTDSGISREIGTQYANVKLVADNMAAVTELASQDLSQIVEDIDDILDFENMTVVGGDEPGWDYENKILTVPTVKGDTGEAGNDLTITSITALPGGAFQWNFSDGTVYVTPSLKGNKGDTGDTGATGDALTITSVNPAGNGTFIWMFSDGTQYVTPSLRGDVGAKGNKGDKGDDGDALTIVSISFVDNGAFTYVFSDGTSYTTPSLKGDQGVQGVPGVRGLQGVSVHHMRYTNTTDPNGDYGMFGELDTYTFYGDADEHIVLGYFSVRNGISSEEDLKGLGLMRRSIYDTDSTGVVDDSERLEGRNLTEVVEEVGDVFGPLTIEELTLGTGTGLRFATASVLSTWLFSQGFLTEVPDGSVTNTKLSPAPPNTIKGRVGTTGTVQDLTPTEVLLLLDVEAGAQANVQTDWLSSSGDSQILNKPEFNTPAQAALASLPVGAKYSTKGAGSVGDGGHGDFIVEVASGTPDGYSRVLLANGNHGVLQAINGVINVLQFGARGDGIVDDTASILAAVLAAAGGKVYFPKGTYLISAEIPLNVIGLQFVGESRFTTLIKQNTLNAKILNISQTFCGVSGLSFIYNGTPTSGATAINVTGSYATLEDFVIRNCHVGVAFSGCAAGKLSNYEILDYESIGLHLQNVNDVFSHSFIFNAGNTTRGAFGGIRLADKVEAFVATDGDILMGRYSLTTDASVNGIGTRPAYNNFTNVFFDSSTLGSVIADLVETEFVGCWFSGGRSGVGLSGVNISTSDSIRFTNTRFFNCGAAGCVVNASTKNVFFTACDFESNSVTAGAGVAHGVSIASGTQGFVFDSCKFGNGLYTGQQGYGAFIDTGCDKFAFTNNIFDSNLTGSISDNATTATDKNFSSNVGHVDPSSDVTLTNVAAIRTRYRNGATNITTDGYYTAGDGGHAEYWYDAADTTTADNGFTVIVAIDGARWKLKPFSSRFNVKQAGAKGDGTANDAPFIQRALAVTSAVKAPLVFPAGDYRLLTYVTFPSNSTLIGEEGAQIYLDPTMTLGTVIGGTARAVYASAVSNISLSGIRFYGTKTGLTKAVTVCLNAVTKLTIDKCTFENMGDVTYYCQGLIIYNSTDVKVTRSKFYNNSGDGLAFSNNVSNYHVSENEFSLNVDWGFALVDGCNNGTVSDNYILNNTSTGAGVDRCSHVTFTGNVIKSNEHGIRVAEFAVSAEKNSHITITGNTISNSQVAGVSIEMMASAYGQYAIVGNTIEGSSNQGIRVSDAEVGTIVGNTIYSCAGDGVLFTASTAGRVTGSAAITGNKIHTCLNGIRQLAGAGTTAPITVGVNDIGPVSAAPIVQINAATSPHMTTVTSVAALRLLRANGTVHVASLGYYSSGDGGGAEYWRDSGDSVSVDNAITVIVAIDGARWKLLVKNKTINVLTAGIKGDSTTNNTTLFNTLAALGYDIQMPDGGYKVTDRIQLVNGQKLQGSGRTASYFVIDTDFNLSATGVIRLGTSEPGAEIYDVGFQFNQANQGVRASCTQYPPAIDGDAIPRFMVDRVRIEGAWDGISVIGNSGGCRIGFIEVGALNVGVDMDGSADFVHTGEWHFWPFGFTSKATLLNGVYYDNTTIGARFGQMEGLNVGSIAMFRCYIHIKSNATTGIPNTFKTIKCDGDGARLLIEGGLNTIGSLYSTKSGASAVNSINCTAGITTVSDYQQIGLNPLTDIVVAGGVLRINGGTIAAYNTTNSTATVSSGSLSIKNTNIRVNPTATYASAMFAQSSTGELIFSDNEVDRVSSGSGNVVSCATDVLGNYVFRNTFGGWGKSYLAGSYLGVYQGGLTYTPRIDGSTTAGTGAYTIQDGHYEYLTESLIETTITVAWSAHTGTGGMRFTLPMAAGNFGQRVSGSVYAADLNWGAGKQLAVFVGSGVTVCAVRAIDPAGGAAAEFFDTAGTVNLTVQFKRATI